MGNAESKTQWERSKLIDRTLAQQRAEQKYDIKLLLLGAGESGKTTVHHTSP